MKKYLFILPALCLIVGCGFFNTLDELCGIGSNFDEYVINHGMPTSQYQMQDGTMMYSYKTPCPHSNQYEETVIKVDTNNIVQSINKTHYCPTNPK